MKSLKGVEMRILLSLLIIIPFFSGCVSIPEVQKTMSSLDSDWASRNEKLMKTNGSRIFNTSRQVAFDALLRTFNDLGMFISKQDYEAGLITAKAPIPRPLSEAEWQQIKAIEEPKMQAYAAQRHSSFVANAFKLSDSNFNTLVNAVISNVSGGIEVSFMYFMEYTGPQTALAYGRQPPPAAVEIGLEKTWEAYESNLIKVAQRKTPKTRPKSGSAGAGNYVSTGTCFAVSPNGYLITNEHVIDDANEIIVRLSDGRKLPAKVITSAESTDLAVLKINANNLDYLTFASSRSVKLGQKAFTIGYPHIGVLGIDPKFTDGVISSKSGIAGEPLTYQITVPVQPGNSGGPLMNERGQVIGVITSTASSIGFLKNTGSLPQNINWAVKSDYVLPLLEDDPKAIKVSNRQSAINLTEKAVCMVISAE